MGIVGNKQIPVWLSAQSTVDQAARHYGATRSHRGLFEKAEGGTIFLDEIGTIDEKIQISLLRLLETRKLEPIGGTKTISANVRIVAATNENLSEAVEQGRFREDLFFRLNVVTLDLPPLRERGDDVLLLAEHFAIAEGWHSLPARILPNQHKIVVELPPFGTASQPSTASLQ